MKFTVHRSRERDGIEPEHVCTIRVAQPGRTGAFKSYVEHRCILVPGEGQEVDIESEAAQVLVLSPRGELLYTIRP